jgi:5,10-methenyltetrahydrofolate synthetase
VTDAWTDVVRWRKAERKRLLAERLRLSPEERQSRNERIGRGLDRAVGDLGGRIVGAYWPFRAEPDLRPWQASARERGALIALPVVIRKGWPLEFRIWSPGDPLERGAFGILVPSCGPSVEPDIVIAPVVGFDGDNYRLGNGGGFFDRTLAAMGRKPLAIGVGHAEARLQTIYPQPHDVPMSLIVTDQAA